ncbi:VOC family protein [Psychromonas antarctica]|uniref:VOC family protein n=1 Tax=Psychromonas antarctica TaxID=67573 RepID=UPI001EE93322|nr:VOC family protein [Psychromonas antarctica]MCG6201046.1 VOC family protein [Psychromonas antarctica]
MISLTQGSHHIGLSVSKLEESAKFFTTVLGWKEVKRNNDYPAIFVSDGKIMITLWETKEEDVEFDRKRNVGLHHIAFQVENEETLHLIYSQLKTYNMEIEFEPELLQQGPAKHMMCYEPSGIRVEFICLGH